MRIKNKFSITLLLTLCSFSSYAALIEKDWLNYGDNLLVIDTNTNLEWLDLSMTDGQTFEEVNSQLNIGNTFEGFRFATEVEIFNLYENAGFNYSLNGQSTGFTDQSGYDALLKFMNMMTPTATGTPEENGTPINISINAYYDGAPYLSSDPFPQIVPMSQLTWWTTPFGLPGLERTDPFYESHQNGDWNSNQPSPSIGSYLVRESVVPIPPAVWLFLSGLVGIYTVAKKKENK